MAMKTLRRRLHHGDIDGRRNEQMETSGYDATDEPLLGDSNYRRHDEGYDDRSPEDWNKKKNEVHLHWSYMFSDLIAQWAQWIANIILSSGSVIGRRFLPRSSIAWHGQDNTAACLSPLQEERLRNLRLRLEVQFDGSCAEHQDALKQLWQLAYPDREIPPLQSELWKEMGWQGQDPSTDFRGGGFVSLENLIYFAGNYPNSFQLLLHKTEGKRAEWEYPFAVAGINLSFMLIQMLDLKSGLPASKAGVRFLDILEHDERAFDNLYCVSFRMLDAQWLAKRTSYMEFNEVLKSIRTQLERELALEDVTTVQDLPAYNMMNS